MQRCACIPYAFCRRFPLLSRWLGASLLSAGRRCHGNVGRLTAGLGSGDVSDVIFLTRQSDGSLGCNLCTAAGAAREREHKGRKMGVLNWNYLILRSYTCRAVNPPSLQRGLVPPRPEGLTEDSNQMHQFTLTPELFAAGLRIGNKLNQSFRFLCVCVKQKRSLCIRGRPYALQTVNK